MSGDPWMAREITRTHVVRLSPPPLFARSETVAVVCQRCEAAALHGAVDELTPNSFLVVFFFF